MVDRYARTQLTIIALALSALATVAGMAGTAMAQTDVTGTWVGRLETSYGRADITFDLKQDGEKVTGTYDVKGTGGAFYDQPVEGTYKDDKLYLLNQRNKMTYIDLSIKEDLMEGKLVGRSSPQKLTATRAKK